MVPNFYKCKGHIYICIYIYNFGNLSNSSVFDDFFSDVSSLVMTCPLVLKCSWYLCSRDDTRKSSRIL